MNKIPVDIDALIRRANLFVSAPIRMNNLGEMSSTNDKYIIRTSNDLSPEDFLPRVVKSFLLSHYLLHPACSDETVLCVSERFRTSLGEEKDRKAFRCCIDLLVPPVEVRKFKRLEDTSSIGRIAKKFCVPRSLVAIILECPYEE